MEDNERERTKRRKLSKIGNEKEKVKRKKEKRKKEKLKETFKQ